MTTFATNFVSCSAVKENVSDVLGCEKEFCPTTVAYDFWLLTTPHAI